MITLLCPECNNPFNRQRIPKVLPCGHSMCAKCIFDAQQIKGYYHCRTCVEKFDPLVLNFAPPTNRLFFEMLESIQQLIRQKQWQQGPQKQNDQIYQTKSTLKLEQQCLYTFCQRKKFQRQGVFQLYCSQQCKQNNQKLEQII